MRAALVAERDNTALIRPGLTAPGTPDMWDVVPRVQERPKRISRLPQTLRKRWHGRMGMGWDLALDQRRRHVVSVRPNGQRGQLQ